MSETAPEPGGRPGRSEKKLFGLPRNVVFTGAAAMAATILYLWWKNRGKAGSNQGTQGANAGNTSGIDYSGQLSTLQSEIQQLQQQGAGGGGGSSGGGGSWGGGGGSWGGSSYGDWGSNGGGSSGGSASGSGGGSSGGGSTDWGTTTTSTGGGSTGSTSSSGGGSSSGGNSAPGGPTGGHAFNVGTTTAEVGWTPGPNTAYSQLRIVGPGPINGHTGTVHGGVGVYSGLQSGHNYEVTVTPYNSSGQAGPSGQIDIHTK